MKKWITIKEAADKLGLEEEAVKSAFRRKNITGRLRNGIVELRVSSLLHYYSTQKETFIRNTVDSGAFNYHPSNHADHVYQSTKDTTKRMTKREIIAFGVEEFKKAKSTKLRRATAKDLQAEFPECRGISFQNIYRYVSNSNTLGQIGLMRKRRSDSGQKRIKISNVYKEFDLVFDQIMTSQGKGNVNNYEGANVLLAYRMALRKICQIQGEKLPANQTKYMVIAAQQILGGDVPSVYYAYQRANSPSLINVARKYRLNRPDFDQSVHPLHVWDNWKQYAFFENVQSDGFKVDERILLTDKDGKVTEKTLQGLIWVEAKTGVIVDLELHLGSINSRKVCLGIMGLIERYGRFETFRFDNGAEYDNQLVESAILSMYDSSELNDRKRISHTDPYKGRQKSPERIIEAIDQYLKDSKGYSGSNRIVGPKPTLGTKPVPACHNLEDFSEIIKKIVAAYNHETVAVDLKYSNISDTDLITEDMQKPTINEKGEVLARRIDLFNAMMKKHHKVIISKDHLTMYFGVADKLTVKNSGVFKTWVGEKFLYLPPVDETITLMPYLDKEVTVRFDPVRNNPLHKMFVFDTESMKYITTVYCDLLQGYTKEQAEEYNKRKKLMKKAMEEFNEFYATIHVLEERLDHMLEDKVEITTESAGKIIKWNPEISRFSENRDREEETMRELVEIRTEKLEDDYVYIDGNRTNKWTGEVTPEDEFPN